MPRWAIISIGVVAIVIVIAIGYPIYAEAKAKADTKAECDGLAREIAVSSVQGGDVTKVATLRAQLEECAARAKELGVPIDDSAIDLALCGAPIEQIAQEWAHYRSTSFDDPVKRENTRTTILRLGEETARCFGEAIEDATTPDQLKKLLRLLDEAIVQSGLRTSCYSRGDSGCSRTGVNEPHGYDKARDEQSRVSEPLKMRRSQLYEKLASLDPTFKPPSAGITGRIREVPRNENLSDEERIAAYEARPIYRDREGDGRAR